LDLSLPSAVVAEPLILLGLQLQERLEEVEQYLVPHQQELEPLELQAKATLAVMPVLAFMTLQLVEVEVQEVLEALALPVAQLPILFLPHQVVVVDWASAIQ
jgi:hypothetical protein